MVVLVGLDDLGKLGAADFDALLDQHAAALGGDLLRGEAPHEVVVGVAPVLEDRHLDVLLRAAVGLADDHVLGDVHQTARQVAGVSGAQRGVGEALSRAVRGDEVLEHRQALHEVGLDRALDDFALRVGHQPAHPRQLADLLERAARAGVGHHEDRVERVEVLDHRVRDLVGGGVPLLHDRLVALLLGDQAHVVLVGDLRHEVLVLLEDLCPCSGGITTSFLEIVMPAWVEYLKPRSLKASSTSEIVVAP